MSRLKGRCPACGGWTPIPTPINLSKRCPQPLPPCPHCSVELCLDQARVPGQRYRVPEVRVRTRSRLPSDTGPDRAYSYGHGPSRALHESTLSGTEPDRASGDCGDSKPHLCRTRMGMYRIALASFWGSGPICALPDPAYRSSVCGLLRLLRVDKGFLAS